MAYFLCSGFVDAHTFPAWTGDKVDDFIQKVAYFTSFLFKIVC